MGCRESKESEAEESPRSDNAASKGQSSKDEMRVESMEDGPNYANGTTGKKSVVLDEAEVRDYFEVEKQTRRYERRNVIKKYETRLSHAEELKKEVDRLAAQQKELVKQTEKEKADVENLEVPSVKEYLKSQNKYESQYDKEQQQYMDALNQQEVNTKELENARKQYDESMQVAEKFKTDADKLNELYAKQDEFLNRIFRGEYGSEQENQLESKLDEGLEWQQRVNLAKFKWTNARVLLVHALTQMTFGVKRWREIKNIDIKNTRMRYFAAAEARNNFMAGSQNIQSARMYINTVEFPYCTPTEMDTVERNIGNIFTDILEDGKYNQATAVYTDMGRKTSNLVQWFDQVIKETILKDHTEANHEVHTTSQDLRAERLRLIQDLCAKQGIHIDWTYDDDEYESDEEDELVALQPDRVNDDDDLPGERVSLQTDISRYPTPLPESQLADAPTENDLFGNVAQMKTDHQKRREQLDRATKANKAKMDDELKRKLSERRTRQQRAMSVFDGNSAGLPVVEE